jgi:hypothetical protein
MSDSVAGKIRIDLLANVAQFKAGMREAGREGLGSFQEEVKRFNRSPGSQKTIAEAIGLEKTAWRTSMMEVRKERETLLGKDRDTMLRFNALGQMNARVDPALRREVRLKSYSPWGMTVRTELTREAALTAAAIGDGGRRITEAYGRAFRDMTRVAGGMGLPVYGLGGALRSAGRLAMAHPFLTAEGVAGGIVGGGAIMETRRKAEEARELGREARNLGKSIAELSAVRNEASGRLGDLITASDVERVHAYDAALRGLASPIRDLQTGLASKTRGMGTQIGRATEFWSLLLGQRPGELITARERWQEEDKAIREAEPRESRRLAVLDFYAKRKEATDRAKALGEIRGRFFSEPDQGMRERILGKDAASEMRDRERMASEMRAAGGKENYIREQMIQLRREQEMDRRGREEDEARQLREREAEAARKRLDAERKQAIESAFTPTERYANRLREISALGLPESQSVRLRMHAGAEARRSLGIVSPEADYRQQALNLAQAFSGGGIPREDYYATMKRLRKSTVAEMVAGQEQGVSPIAAMGLGSAAAHALITQSQLAGPEIQLAKEANAKLDSIDRGIRALSDFLTRFGFGEEFKL